MLMNDRVKPQPGQLNPVNRFSVQTSGSETPNIPTDSGLLTFSTNDAPMTDTNKANHAACFCWSIRDVLASDASIGRSEFDLKINLIESLPRQHFSSSVPRILVRIAQVAVEPAQEMASIWRLFVGG